jgi:aspartyl-tRNA(Asn)/glutamyl-tRNA(Gln) amidotransferase subunit A
MPSNKDLIFLTIQDALKGLIHKDFTAQELVEAHMSQMGATQNLNAYITQTFDQALNAAKESDVRIAQGEARPLDGIPIATKDLFCTKGVRTTAGSKILENFVPPYESTIGQKLLDAGVIILGKTNMDEFAMGSSNITSAYGPTLSPWKTPENKHCLPGGSSGGSAAAVASFSAMAATGTDTGGSIRQPAAFSGIVGVKPTYGRCSRFGVIAFASSLDQAGPLTRTVEDSALMLQHMSGFDERDPTSIHKTVPNFCDEIGRSVKGLKIGIPEECRMEGMRDDVLELWQKASQVLQEAGAIVKPISLPMLKYALPTYYIIAPAEASSNLARYDGVRFGLRVEGESLDELYMQTRAAGFGPEVKRRIITGTHVLSSGFYDAYYVKAQKLRACIIQDFQKNFTDVDMILTPSAPTPAFALGEEPKDPVTMYMNDIYTVIANLAGLPGISIPFGLSKPEGLPLGVQLIAPAFEEGLLFKAGHVLYAAAEKDPIQALREII